MVKEYLNAGRVRVRCLPDVRWAVSSGFHYFMLNDKGLKVYVKG